LTDSGDVDVPCTVDSGTTTSLSLTLTSPPIGNLGELTATVSNANGTSDEVQVATVIDCGGITVAFLGSLATGAEETSLTFPLEDVEGLLVVDLGVLALGLTPTVEFDGDAMDLDSSVPVGGSDTATQYRYSLAVSGPVSGDLVVTLASAKWMGVLVHMVTGLADDALDQVGTSAGTSSNPTTNSITTTTAAEIIIATALVRRDGKTIDSADWTNSFSGMFFDPFMGICDTADEHEMVAAYRIVGETGSYSTQVSNIYTTVPNKWATIIGSYS
jgi:hypothetical protein